MENYNIFNMHCDVHYYPAKFELKFNFVWRNKKEKLYYGVK